MKQLDNFEMPARFEIVYHFGWFFVREKKDYSGRHTIMLYNYMMTTYETQPITDERMKLYRSVEYQAIDGGIAHGTYAEINKDGKRVNETYYHNGVNLKVNPNRLTEADKMYIELSGRLPERFKNESKSDIP